MMMQLRWKWMGAFQNSIKYGLKTKNQWFSYILLTLYYFFARYVVCCEL